MPRVLHVIRRIDGGGAARSLIAMAKYSARLGGFEHRALSLVPACDAFAAAARAAGMPVLDAPRAATAHAEIERADVVQVHFWNSPELYAFLRADLPPLRLLLRSNVGGERPPQVLTEPLVDFCDVLAAGSPHTLELPVCSRLDPATRRDKLALLYPAADFERLAGPEPQPHAGLTVGYVGSVDFAKMHPGFVRMCAAVGVDGVRFIVCGGGPARATLARQAARQGLAGRLELCGHVEDVGSVLARLDVFGYPLCEANYSTSEAVLHEAMAAGVPPVVLDHGGARYTVEHGRTGLVARDEADYVRSVERLLRDPARRARFGAAARAHAWRHFGAENSARRLHQICDRMLRAPRRARRWPGPAPATAAEAFVASLGHAAGPFATSLRSQDCRRQLEAEDAVGASGPTLASPGGGGIVHWRNHAPRDAMLRLWSGLLLERRGQNARALAEYLAAERLGLTHPRVLWYQARAASDLGAADLVRRNLRRVVRDAPEIGEARAMLAARGIPTDA